MRRPARLVAALAIAGAVAACSAITPAATLVPDDALPVGERVVTPPEQMRLELVNSTTVPVVLSVNGGVGREFPPGGGSDLGMAEIGPPPWKASVRTRGGTLLLHVRIEAGSTWRERRADGSVERHSAGAWVDLSCGRLGIYVGVPMAGPPPGPGVPGDCDP